jgi:hypothetical protein
VGNNTWDSVNGNGPSQHGAIIASPGLFAHYRTNMTGTNGQAYINALIRLKGGEAAIPAFRADLARVSGRSDIDVFDVRVHWVDPIRRLVEYESACVLAFGLAARESGQTPASSAGLSSGRSCWLRTSRPRPPARRRLPRRRGPGGGR